MSEPFIMVPKHIAARTDLPAGAKLVYAAIMDRMGRNEECWPGWRRLARDCGICQETAGGYIARLEAVGLLVVVRQSRGRCNRYRLPAKSTGQTRAPGKTEHPEKHGRSTGQTRAEVLGKHGSNKTDPENKTHKGAQRAGDEAGDALGLAVLYRDLVLPGDRTCTPAGRAARNAEKLLKNRDATIEQLWAAVTNYAKALDAEDRPAGYRKAGGNFFGRDGVWREYLEPLSAEELQRLRNDQHRNGNRSGKGGAIIPPGDFSGREDAIAL